MWVDCKSWKDAWASIGDIEGGAQSSCKIVHRKDQGQENRYFLKILNRQSDPERRYRFFREASAYSEFKHERLPDLCESNAHKYDDLDHNLYIVVELIEGRTLSAVIEEGGPVSFAAGYDLITRLLEVVSHFHSRDWVHRDIKPDNIMLRKGSLEDPVIVDFGLGYSAQDQGTATLNEQEIGNRFLRLPELAGDSPTKRDVRSDLTSLAGVLLYALSGKQPVQLRDADGKLPHQRTAIAAPLSKAAAEKLWPLQSFFDRALHPDLAPRFASAAEMGAALKKVAELEGGNPEHSIDDLYKELCSRVQTIRNQELRQVQIATSRVLNRIQRVHKKVVDSAGETFVYCQSNQQTSNTGVSSQLGFAHFGDASKNFMPPVDVHVVGSELVVGFDGETIWRTGFPGADPDKALDEAVERRYLSGLIELIKKI